MGISKLVSGILPKWFSKASYKDNPNQPPYFMRQEHFDAVEEIIDLRKDSITKQGRDFDDLEGDLEILTAAIFRGLQEGGQDEVQAKRDFLSHLREASVDEKRTFLAEVSDVFNHGWGDQKPATVKWVTSGSSEFAKIMVGVRANQELLNRHSVKIFSAHEAENATADHSTAVRDGINLIRLSNGFVESIAGARTELNKGFGRIYKIQTDANDILLSAEDIFDQEFGEYIDGMSARLDKVKGSKASPSDHEKWADRINEAEALLKTIRQRQVELAPPPVGADITAEPS